MSSAKCFKIDVMRSVFSRLKLQAFSSDLTQSMSKPTDWQISAIFSFENSNQETLLSVKTA